MKELLFTPGPWTTVEFLPDENGNNLISETYQQITAGCGYLDDEGIVAGFTFSGCMTKADARLIAAAPDMYAALEGVISTYVFLESPTAGIEPQHCNTVRALNAVRAALAKAVQP